MFWLFSRVDLHLSNNMPKIIFCIKSWLALRHLVTKFIIYSMSWIRGWMLNLKQSDTIESAPCPNLHPHQKAMQSLNCLQLAHSNYIVFCLIWSICQQSQLDVISAMTWAAPHQSVTSIFRSPNDLMFQGNTGKFLWRNRQSRKDGIERKQWFKAVEEKHF